MCFCNCLLSIFSEHSFRHIYLAIDQNKDSPKYMFFYFDDMIHALLCSQTIVALNE